MHFKAVLPWWLATGFGAENTAFGRANAKGVSSNKHHFVTSHLLSVYCTQSCPLLLDGQTQSGALRAVILPCFPHDFNARHFNTNPTLSWKERVVLNLFILKWSNLCCCAFCVCFWIEQYKQLHPFSSASLHLLLLLFPSAQSSSAGSSTAEHTRVGWHCQPQAASAVLTVQLRVKAPTLYLHMLCTNSELFS